MPATSSFRHSPQLLRRGIVLLLCLALGLQWALVQGIAWTEMLISFASEGSVMEAVEKTFDGRHGCALCKKVQEGSQTPKSEGQAPEKEDALKGLDAVLVSHTALIPPAGETLSFAPLHAVLTTRSEMPETPPPRRGQV